METTQLYSMVFDAIKDPLLLLDEAGSIALANATALNFFEIGEPRTLASLRPVEADVVLERERIDELLQHESVRDFRLSGKNGQESGVALDVETILGADNTRYKLLHFRDESREAHREFWKDEMIAMVSHEIKNPLSAMKNSVDLLLTQIPGELTEGQKHFLSTSGRSIDRLTHMLDGFLDVSRIHAGAFDLNRKDTDVGEFLPRVMQSFTTLFNTRRADVTWDVAQGVGSAWIDPDKVEQVLINALSNALKFTTEGGRISVDINAAGIEAVEEELRLIPWNDLGKPRMLVVTITDTGLGMTSETLDHIFNRYHGQPGDGARKGEHLGLNISRALVEAQNGWLNIDSRIGIGTTVKAYLPSDRHTATLMSRLRQIRDLVKRQTSARRRLGFYVLGKFSDEDWSDIASTWVQEPVINPNTVEVETQPLYLWTLDGNMAVAVRCGYGHGEPVEKVFGSQFVVCDEGAHVFNGYAVGGCWLLEEGSSFTQVFHIANNRMTRARNVMAQSAIEKLDHCVECVINENEQAESLEPVLRS